MTYGLEQIIEGRFAVEGMFAGEAYQIWVSMDPVVRCVQVLQIHFDDAFPGGIDAAHCFGRVDRGLVLGDVRHALVELHFEAI